MVRVFVLSAINELANAKLLSETAMVAEPEKELAIM